MSADSPLSDVQTRLHRRGARVQATATSSLAHDAYTDHSPAQNRQAIDAASRAFWQKTQNSSQDCGQSAWPATAYASYISAKAEQCAEDARATLDRIRRKRLQARKAL